MADLKHKLKIIYIFIWIIFFEANVYSISDPVDKEKFSVAGWTLLGTKGSSFSQFDVESLPAGGHTGSILEFWLNPTILSNVDTGGLSSTESKWLNIHGGSQAWQKFWLNGMDITDPADPGRPIFDLPIRSWQNFSVRSILHNYDNQSGYSFQVSPGNNILNKPVANINLAGMNSMGGPDFLPKNTLDREPASLWGAPDKKRRFLPSFEGDLTVDLTPVTGTESRVFVENITHRREFLSLDEPELSSRTTMLFSAALGGSAIKKRELILGYQRLKRDFLGAERGNKKENTLFGNKDTLISLFKEEKFQNDFGYKFLMGLGIANAGFGSRENGQNRELTDEILYGPLPIPNKTRSIFLDSSIDLKGALVQKELSRRSEGFLSNTIYNLKNRIRFENIEVRQEYNNNAYQRYYNGLPLDVTLFDNSEKAREYLVRYRPSVIFETKGQRAKIEYGVGGALEGGFSGGETLITRISPTGKILFSYFWGPRAGPRVIGQHSGSPRKGVEFFTGIQHEALGLTDKEVAFLNKNRLSGKRFQWVDFNNDLKYQAGEEGEILNRTGPKYHVKDEKLKAPVMEEFATGATFMINRKWNLTLQSTARWFRNLYQVRYANGLDSDYVKVDRADNPMGGFLYDRTVGNFGNEIYKLTNNPNDGYYVNLEFQILKKKIHDRWFLNASVVMHYGEGYPPPGNGPEYNDLGFFDESTADPNNRLANYARTDYDRGYVLNVIFGGDILDNFTVSNVLRYRDGEPFGQYIIAEGLSQGVAPVQVETRARPPMGMPRFTYAFTWDIRFLLKLKVIDSNFLFFIDIYNLLNSQTEIQEYTINGEKWRDPTEAHPERSFKVGMTTRI